mgnify:CR=1 FL=1
MSKSIKAITCINTRLSQRFSYLSVFILFLTFFSFSGTVSAQSRTQVYVAHYGDVEYYGISLGNNFAVSQNASVGGTAVTNGSNVCTGSSLDVTVLNASTTTELSNSKVSCALDCTSPDTTSALTAFPLPILWQSSGTYSSNVNSYSPPNAGDSFCKGPFDTPQPPNPLAPNTENVNYDIIGIDKGTARANLGLFCYGSTQTSLDGSSVSSPVGLNTNGSKTLLSSMIVNECSMLVRSYENPGFQGKPWTADCLYSPVGGFFPLTTASTTTFNVVRGVNLTGPFGSYTANPSSTMIITLPVTNTGDLGASVTGISLSAGFTVNSIVPALPVTVAAGTSTSFTINASTPAVAGNYTPNATVTFTPTPAAIGACGVAGSTASVSIGNIVVAPGVVPGGGPSGGGPGCVSGITTPLSITMRATPASLLNTLLLSSPPNVNNVTLVAEISRPNSGCIGNDIKANITVYSYNASGQRNIVRYKSTDFSCIDAGVSRKNAKTCYPASSVDGSNCIYSMSPSNSPGVSSAFNFTVIQPFLYSATQSSVCPADQYGIFNSPFSDSIYEAEISISDPIASSTQTRSTFFGIYGLTCQERA